MSEKEETEWEKLKRMEVSASHNLMKQFGTIPWRTIPTREENKEETLPLHDFKTWLKAEYPDAYTFNALLKYWENKFWEETT